MIYWWLLERWSVTVPEEKRVAGLSPPAPTLQILLCPQLRDVVLKCVSPKGCRHQPWVPPVFRQGPSAKACPQV